MRRNRKPDRRKAKNRNALLKAAEMLFGERGVERVAIDEITEAADLSKGTFYSYFEDKDSIAAEIAQTARAELVNDVRIVQVGVEDPAERLALGIGVFLLCAAIRPNRAAIVAQMFRLWLEPDAAGNEGLYADLENGYRQGRFLTGDITAANVLTIGMVEAGMRQVMKLTDLPSVRALAINLCCLELHALGVPAKQAQVIATRGVRRVVDTVSGLIRSEA